MKELKRKLVDVGFKEIVLNNREARQADEQKRLDEEKGKLKAEKEHLKISARQTVTYALGRQYNVRGCLMNLSFDARGNLRSR